MQRAFQHVLGVFLMVVCALSLVALSSLSVVQAEEQKDYFPLHVGNSWTYERKVLTWLGERYDYVLDYVTVTITHTEEIGGNIYYVFSDGRIYRKTEDDHVLEYQNGEEFLLYDFSDIENPRIGYELARSYKGVGIMASIQGGGTLRASSPNSVIVPAGTFSSYSFYYSSVNEQDFLICFAPSVGMVRYSVEDVLWGKNVIILSLVNATVNGKQYGVSAVNPSSWGKIKSLFQ